MKLSDLFEQGESSVAKKTIDKTIANDPKQNYRLQQQLRALKPGQTLQGEVVGRNGSEVLIKISDDLILTARMDADLPVELGKIMTFEVKGSGGQTLSLSPLFENMGTDANVLKALNMAGLPMNNTTIAMTESMMEGGLSIGKNSLLHMYKNIINYPQVSPQNMVILNKLGVELTPENLQQLENYQKLQHQIIKDTTHIIDELPLQFKSLMQEGNQEGAMKLIAQAFKLVNSEQGVVSALPSTPATGVPLQVGETGMPLQVGEIGMEIKLERPLTNQQATIENNTNVLANEEEKSYNKNTMTDTTSSLKATQVSEGVSFDSVYKTSTSKEAANPIAAVLSEAEVRTLSQQLKSIGIEEALVREVRNGSIEIGTLMKLVAEFITGNGRTTAEQSAPLLTGKEFQTLLKSQLQAQWTISPEEGLNQKNIDSLYQRLKSQLSSLEDTLSQIMKSENSLPKSVTNLKNNLEFIQQLNQTFTYVQLPLKMRGGKAHGDLYVYTNKRSLAQNDGKVSALLHLDMQNLGPVDIYVAMENQKVSTHFYLQEDKMLTFIEKNIHILNERLGKRGYSMSCEMSIKEGTKTMIDEMLTTEKSLTQISQFSFDVRA